MPVFVTFFVLRRRAASRRAGRKRCCYELAIYGSDEDTRWVGVYRSEISGERHRVAVITTGYFGTLIVDGDELKLATEGAVFRFEDELRGSKLEVGIVEPQKPGANRVVKRWNDSNVTELRAVGP